jgi:uncharacterized repeat protein (TIGR01451 family)
VAPGATCVLESAYTLTQDDVDAGEVTNDASVKGTPPTGDDVTDDATDTKKFTRSPSVELVKTLDPSGGRSVGDTLTYQLVATNTGNVTLTGVVISDELQGLSALSCLPSAPAALAPDEELTCSATYTVTQADVDAGAIINTAVVSSLGPARDSDIGDESTQTEPLDRTPSIDLTKVFVGHTDANANGRVDAGEVFTWTVTATNTGNVTLSGVVVTDDLTGGTITCATVAPEGTCAVQSSYAITQEDLDRGEVTNDASVTGVPPTGSPVQARASDSQTLTADPRLTLAKAVTVSGICDEATGRVGLPEGGGTVRWCFTLSNPGNVTLNDVVVNDELLEMSASSAQPDGLPARLAPGDTITVSVTSFVRSTVTNVATAGALSPVVESAPSSAIVDVDPDRFELSGTVWFDQNRNGQIDPGEPMLPGINVELVADPQAGSASSVRPQGAQPAGIVATVRSGAAGQYLFGRVPVGSYVVQAIPRFLGLTPGIDESGDRDWKVPVTLIDGPRTVIFPAVGAGTLRGTATDVVTGRTLSNVELRCTWWGDDDQPIDFVTTAGVDGRYEIEGLPFGTFSCIATEPGTGATRAFVVELTSSRPVVADVAFGEPSGRGPLPVTGAELAGMLGLGLSMVVGGVAVRGTSRRRRR